MRICYTSDLHGRLGLYAQLTNLLRAERVELLVLGGDMHAECTPADPLGTQVAFVERRLASMIDAWKTMVSGLEVACILGNHDMVCTHAALWALHESDRLVLLDHHQPWEKGGLYWLGFAPTPPSPYWVKDFERLDLPGDPIPDIGGAVWDLADRCVREVEPRKHFGSQPTLAEELDRVPDPAGPWIFVCHAPPHATNLDRLPNLEEPIGSRAVREFIEKRRPRGALHGHVHESPEVTGDYKDHVAHTLCINPGQTHDRLHAVLFDTANPADTLWHTVYG